MAFQMSERTWELISAMQKFVRRGMEKEAGQAFFELSDTGAHHIAVNRLKVIAHEDIGLGDIGACLFALRSIDDCQAWYAKKNGAWRLAISNAILALCRAKKSRESDHYQAAVRGANVAERVEIPDYALDKHTRRGKIKGRGLDHFRSEGAKLYPEHHDKYEEAAYEAWASGKLDALPEQGKLDALPKQGNLL